MDWFERLTGFRETNHDDTRAKLAVDGNRLKGKSAQALSGWLKVSVVRGDVRKMHRLPENANALFQVASQFNLLEMTSYDVTPGARRHPLPTVALQPRSHTPALGLGRPPGLSEMR
jgi:hypothetical protein